MSRRFSIPIALVMLLCAVPAVYAQAPEQPLTVFVAIDEPKQTGKPTKAESQQASAAIKAAVAARKDLEKSLKAQYGKRDKWPAEALEQMLDAEDTVTRLGTDWLYRSEKFKPLDDWQSGIRDAVKGDGLLVGTKTRITPAASRDEAQLVVELTGQRSSGVGLLTLMDKDFCVVVRLARGPKMSAAQFLRVPRTYLPGVYKVTRLQAPSEGTPFWRFEGCGEYLKSATSNAIATLVDEFVKTHYDVLTAAATR